MLRVLAIAWKDLRLTFRDVPALAMMLAAPLVLTMLLGLAFGGAEGFSLPTTTVMVADLDLPDTQAGGQTVGQSIRQGLSSEGLRDLLTVEPAATENDARRAVDEGEAVVALIIPDGLTASLLNADPAADRPQILLYRDPSADLQGNVVTSIVQRMVDEVNGAWLAAAAAVTLRHTVDGAPDRDAIMAIAADAQRRYGELTQGRAVDVAAREPRAEEGGAEPGIAALVLPGMMLFSMFLAGMNTARGILDEDMAGTLPRLFTTPTPRDLILAGKLTSVFLTVLSQTVVLIVAGLLIFRIDWGDPLPVMILTLMGAFTAASLGVFVLSFLRTPAQAGALSTAVVLILALLGGNFVGGITGGWFNAVRRATPNGWLLIAWERIIRGGSLGDILVPVGVLAVFSAVTFTAGALLFRRRYL